MKTVLDVGQCDADHGSIRRLVESIGARVVRADTEQEALDRLKRERIDLVLVNRILDADGSDGISLIRKIRQEIGSDQGVMLVSNYPEYQDRAVQTGALKGFGKTQLRSPETSALLKAALEVKA